MQTDLPKALIDTLRGAEAEKILRSCVHCGFCNATCPTYRLSGNELDGPRGRIYQIKQMLEGQHTGGETRLHLDRCLTCLNCETTCPSGVQYHRLLDIGRQSMNELQPPSVTYRLTRSLMTRVLSSRTLFGLLFTMARAFSPLLPEHMKPLSRPGRQDRTWPGGRNERRMLMLDGCVQPVMAPEINAACARVLQHLNITVLRSAAAGCCGAIAMHAGDQAAAETAARKNIDAW